MPDINIIHLNVHLPKEFKSKLQSELWLACLIWHRRQFPQYWYNYKLNRQTEKEGQKKTCSKGKNHKEKTKIEIKKRKERKKLKRKGNKEKKRRKRKEG